MHGPCPIGRDPKGSPCRCPAGRPWTGPTVPRHPRISGRSGPRSSGCPPDCRAGRRARASPAMTTGIGFTPFETRVDTMVRLARQADERGLARVGVAEAWGHDATIVLAEMAAQTSRIELGTGVLSVWGRTPATLALAAAGLQRISDGRFSLGLGAGSPPLTEGLHGVPWERPVARVREALIGVRALLAGDRLPQPAPGARPLRLGVVPATPVPIALAALA